jgi:hypothetical protein
MRAPSIFGLWLLLVVVSTPANAARQATPPEQVVDAIAARVEDDIITLSEMRELAAYQQLVDGHSQTDEELRSELIEQWVVDNEAITARFPLPAQSEVDREVARLEKSFASESAYQQRLSSVGLTPETVRRIITRQIYLARYLDYKFRSSVQVNQATIDNYYNEHLVPELRAKGQQPPPLEEVTDQIRELLIEQGVNDRTAAWFYETKQRLKIELEPLDALSQRKPGTP